MPPSNQSLVAPLQVWVSAGAETIPKMVAAVRHAKAERVLRVYMVTS